MMGSEKVGLAEAAAEKSTFFADIFEKYMSLLISQEITKMLKNRS